MPTQSELDRCYMECARAHARLSKATRKKVGACFVTREGVLVPGYNGTVSGSSVPIEVNDSTTSDCIHAELNGVLKAAREGISLLGATLYVTLSPCELCAPMIAQAGIKRVVYDEDYRISTGKSKLVHNYGVKVEKFAL